MSFKELGLSENILKAIDECGYTEPTPIQAQAIPLILMMRDLVGLAQTGTGKTAGFTLPMIEILAGGRAKARMPRSLVLAPTRELAAQVAENFETYGKYSNLSMALLVGGVSMEDQIRKLERGVDVLIATPGRMLDLFDRGKILLTDIKILVIDEADRMLDMGFIPDIEKIVSLLSPMRQTLLFSATMSPEIKKLTLKFQSNPKEVSVAQRSSTADKVKQFLIWTSPREKQKVLENLIRDENVQNAFIFCNRKRDVDTLTKGLKSKGYDAKALHGDMAQKIRTDTLAELKAGKVRLLVCSDVAARGLDVDDLSHVFNYDVPFNAEDYVHRIGRTGRAGKEGRAWTLATKSDDKYVEAIEKLIKQKIEVAKSGGKSGGDKGEKSKPEPKKKQAYKEDKRSPKKAGQQSKSAPVTQGKPSERSRPPEKRKDVRESEEGLESSNTKGFGDDMPGFFGKS